MENVLGENQKFYFNGKEIKERQIRLQDNENVNQIEIIL